MTKSSKVFLSGVVALAMAVSSCRGCDTIQQHSYGEIRIVSTIDGVTQSLETGSYDFGPVAMGKTVTMKLTVQNVGAGTLSIERFEKNDGAAIQLGDSYSDMNPVFKLAYGTVDIPSGESQDFDLSFNPPLDATQKQVDYLTNITLKAANTDPNGFDTAAIAIKGRAISGECDLPRTLDFGAVAKGDSFNQTVTLSNQREIDTLASVRPIESAQGETVFTYTPDSPQGEFTLSAGKTRTITIVFSPTEARDYFATARMRAADGCPEVPVRLIGTGVDQVLTWAPSPLDFGYVAPMMTAAGEITFSNQAMRPVELTQLGAFDTTNTPSTVYKVTAASPSDLTKLTVPAATRDANNVIVPGTAKLNMSFKPVALGLKLHVLKANTDLHSQASIAVSLRGVGGGPAIDVRGSPIMNFGRIAYFPSASPASFASKRLTVQNVGTRPSPPDPRANLHLGAQGAGAPYWSVTANNTNTTADELCLGIFDTATQTCANSLPANGPGAYDPAVGLEAAGTRALLDIPVRVTPQSIGQKEWTVKIFSNDPTKPTVTITVQANAVTLPPCNYSVTPLNLNYGVVTPPSVKDLTFKVKNNSSNTGDLCLLSNLDMRAGSDPTFVLPSGAVAEKELQPQEEWIVPVRAWPQGQLPSAPQQVTGAVLFNVSNPSAPQATVNLSATLAVSCLTISPSDLDFGTVQKNCNSPDKAFQIYNTCSGSVTIQSFSMVAAAGEPAGGPNCPGTAPCPEFLTVSTGGIAPNTVIASGSTTPATFSLKYRPINYGPDQGAFLIKALQNGQTVDYVVTLKGKGDTMGLNTDTFRQDSKPKADILLVVDNSCSMYDKQQALAQNFGSFIKYAVASQVDFQIGITTTDMDPGGENGRIVASSSAIKIFRPTTANLEQQFAQTINLGTNGSGTETCMEPALVALSAPLITDPNANLGLLRPDAVLAVVCVTDAVDQAPQPPSFYLNQMMNIKGAQRPGAFTYNVVGPFSQPTATCDYDSTVDDGKHAFMVAQTNGVKEEICTPDWAKALENIGKSAFGYRTNFYLTAHPDLSNGNIIDVQIDGVSLPAVEPTRNAKVWEYDSTSNSINFQPLYVPQPGDTLTVTYQVACIP